MFDGGGFALIYDSGKLSEQPEPGSIPVVLAPHEDTIKDYIQCAASGADHWDALTKAAAMLLRSRQPLGDALSVWKAGGQTKRPDGRKVTRGRRKALRNSAIIEAIRALERCGRTATRNDESARNSACDAVAEAFGLSYESIRKIWYGKPS